MFRKLQFAIMLLPVLVACYLTFRTPTVHAIPAHQIVAFDPSEVLNDPETEEEVVVASNE